MQKKTRKKWPGIVLAILIVLIAAFSIQSNRMRHRTEQPFYNTHTVSSGSVEVSVTGSGMLEPIDTKNISLPDGITIEDVLVHAGDKVDAGQKLAVLDPDSLRNQAASLSDELSSLDKQLAQMNSSKTTASVYSPVKGRIKYLPVSVDDDVISSVARHGALALLSTDGLMRVEIKTDQTLELYDEVTVKWNDGEKIGDVIAKTENGYRITLTDNGTPYGEDASVYDGDTLVGSGVLQINKPISVYANGGTVAKIHYKENASIRANTKLFTLDHKPLSNSYQQTYSQRQELAEQLQTLLAYIDNPYVVAANEGTISEVLITDGETTGSGNATATSTAAGDTGNAAFAAANSGKSTATSASGESAAFVMNIAGAPKMTIAVDELDIGSILPDQSARITLDAISSETFEATVSRISFLGTAKGNITTYAVELTLKNDERFLPGMNGNATIMVNRKDNVLLVPIEAINEDETGIFVYVSASEDGSDRQRRDITTGLSDGEYAEITSGLSQGDRVLYLQSASDESPFPGMPSRFNSGFDGRNNGGDESDN